MVRHRATERLEEHRAHSAIRRGPICRNSAHRTRASRTRDAIVSTNVDTRAMKKLRKKVAYRTASKRNLMMDILTDAGRRAKHRAAEKLAEAELRAALDYPRDEKGKPIAGHIVKTIAASFIHPSSGIDRAIDFEFAAGQFLRRL